MTNDNLASERADARSRYVIDLDNIPNILETIAPHAERNNVCVKTIQRWTTLPNGLPFTKRGRLHLFNPRWTAEWILANRQQMNVPRRGRAA